MRHKEGGAPSPSTEQLSLTVNFKKVLIYNTENEKKLPKLNIKYLEI